MNNSLSPEELLLIQNLNFQREHLIKSLGKIEYELQTLEVRKNEVIQQLHILEKNLKTLGTELHLKYGEVGINLNTGEIQK